jgi:hypothetical protein
MENLVFHHYTLSIRAPPSKKSIIEAKSRTNAIFRLSLQYSPSLIHGSVFSIRKCQIRIPRMFLPLKGTFPEKIFTWVTPPPIV